MGEAVTVLGPYRLIEQLTVGRTAELFLATLPGEAGFEKKVVIKRLLPQLESDEPSKASFIDEAKLAAKLVHPRIAQTFELKSEGGALYVAMEHVDGVALDVLARELAARQRRLEPQVAAWIAHEMLDALDFAHAAKIVHGDLATSKVLLSARGDVKLVGFGVARYEGDGEMWRDVFATGVVLAELLTGHRLFAGANELRIMRLKLERFERCLVDVEPALADIVRRALRTATDIRWDTAGFREALAEWAFAHGHRITAQHVASIVGELRAVVDERKRAANDSEPPPPGNRASSLDALPPVNVTLGPVPGHEPYQPPRKKTPSIEIPPVAAVPDAPMAARGSQPIVAAVPPPGERPRQSTRGFLHPARAPGGAQPRKTAEMFPIAKPAERSERQTMPRVKVPDKPAPVVPARPPTAPTTTEIAFDDLGDPVEQPSLANEPPETGEPDEFGDLVVTPAIAVLFKRMVTRATGALHISLHAVKKEIFFVDGRPESVATNIAAEQIGNYLVARGALANSELSRVLEALESRPGDIGELIVEQQLVDANELRKHWSELTRESVIDVATWKKGTFQWYAGREARTHSFRLDASPFELLGEAALRLDDRLVLPTQTAQGQRKLVASPEPRVDPNCFGIEGMDELFGLFDGSRTVDEIVRRYPDRTRAYRMLYLLEACELIAP